VKRLDRLVGAIPLSFIEVFGVSLGCLAFSLDARHRRIVMQNIAFAFPELAPKQIHRLARRVFQHFGVMVLETLQAPFFSTDQLANRIRIEGKQVLLEAMDHPRGCLICSAHLGNWELGLMAMAAQLNRSVMTVAKPIKLKLIHRWLTALRWRFGNTVVFKKGAMSAMTKALRSGRSVAILIDQGVRRNEAVEVKFFGRRTMATPAAAFLALRNRVPVVPMVCTRDTRGCYVITVQPPVHFERSGDLQRDIQDYTQRLINSLEIAIRTYPEQWFWFHRRWKRTHPSVYPEYQKLRRRKRIKKGLKP